MNKALERNLDAALDGAVEQRRIVGGVVVVLREGETVYRRAVGLADRESGTAMQSDTIFRLASITKPIATVAAMRLVEAGQLDLDASITRYLPDFRPKLGDREPTVTVRQLLTHTSGLSYGFMQPKDGTYSKLGVSDGLDAPGLALEEELRRIVRAGLFYEPGTQWGYSLGLDVLGAAIEKVTGKRLPAAITELVTGPLGLTRTTFEAPVDKPLAIPYADGTPPVRMGDPHVVPFFGLSGIRFSPSRVFDASSFPSAGTGMNGTADEVARLLEVVRSGTFLERPLTQAMLRNQTGALPIVFGPGWGFGLGGAVLLDPRTAQTPQSAGTWTWGGVWGHSWFVDPAKRLVVVGLTNTAIEGMMGGFPVAVRDAVYASFAE